MLALRRELRERAALGAASLYLLWHHPNKWAPAAASCPETLQWARLLLFLQVPGRMRRNGLLPKKQVM